MIFDLIRKNDTNRILTTDQLERTLRRGSATSSGVHVSPSLAMQFGTVFACVRVRAESIGQLPLHLYERRGREKVKIPEHPLYSLLHDAPNEATTAQEFWEWVSASLDLHGNAYAHINRVGGRVFELLPLDADWVEVRRDAKRDPRYVVRVPGTEPRVIPPADILHIKLMSLNGLTGASVIEQARNTIGLAMAQERHGAAFFKNGATVGGVLQTDQVLDEPTYDALVDAWEEAQTGLDNAYRTAILEAGVKYEQVGMSLADSQYLEGRAFSQTEIAGLFRVPPHLIGNLEHATFSNIEQQGLDYVIHGLTPTMTRIEQRLRLQMFAKEDRTRYYAKFNAGGLVRGDMAARSAFYTTLLNAGALSPNEIRELEDMNPREGGDVFLTPLNMTPNAGGTKPPGEDEDDDDAA